MLKLVQMDNVVNLPVREPSTFDDGWSARAGQMKKRGDGKDKTRKLWDKAAKKVGSAALLAALKRYLREEKEPTCGYPGLSVWLNGERYDHWLCAAPQPGQPTPEAASRSPEPLRGSLLVLLGEPFVLSYLDPCTFHEDGFITPATEYAMRKLVEQKGALKAAGVVGIRRKE